MHQAKQRGLGWVMCLVALFLAVLFCGTGRASFDRRLCSSSNVYPQKTPAETILTNFSVAIKMLTRNLETFLCELFTLSKNLINF